MKLIQKIFCTLLTFPFVFCPMSVSAVSQATTKGTNLQMNKEGKFKILVLSDIQETNKPQKESLDLIKNAIDKTKPDLIVLTGDNIAGWWKGVDKAQTEQAVDNIAKIIDEKGIPFALVFGNHDHEGLCDEVNGMEEEAAKELILSWYQKYDTCASSEGEEMTGVGNYNLPIKNSLGDKMAFNLWFMDSNAYATDEEGGGYGYVHEDQTNWYIKTSESLKNENGGNVVPSLLFQHIIVPEVYDMLGAVDKSTPGSIKGHNSFGNRYFNTKSDAIYQGNVNEAPCPPDKNAGQFESWIKQGDILGAFFGHDHNNDFAGIYKNIHLVATPAVTYYSYGENHGVRTITLDEKNPTQFTSDIILFEDLVDYKPANSYIAKHGYYEYKNVFLPALFGSIGAVVLLTALGVVIGKSIKKKNRNRE